MKETTLKKQFTERDLQRVRNLATKKIHDKTITSVGYTKAEEKREEGDVWESDGRTWTISNGIKKTVRKVENATIPLLCPKCSKPMKHQLDKQMYGIHQMCLHCVTDMESWLKMNGEYEEYERNMIRKNAQYFVDNVTNGLDQFLDDVINESYVTEDGTIQNWIGNGIDKIEVKKQIMEKLQKLKAATEK
jgi:hypothetical protein